MAGPDLLRQHWLDLLAWAHEQTQSRVSELPCLQHCPEGICERGEQVFFLPFEVEFIAARSRLDLWGTGAFWLLALPPAAGEETGSGLRFGLKGSHRRCPFLDSSRRCSIHADRPLDCRSFPLLPEFYRDGSAGGVLRPYCPLTQLPDDDLLRPFVELYGRIWTALAGSLPASWKVLYWHSKRLVPEVEDPGEPARLLELGERLAHVGPEMLRPRPD